MRRATPLSVLALGFAAFATLVSSSAAATATINSEPDGSSRRVVYSGSDGAEAFVYAGRDGAYLFQSFPRGSSAASGTPIIPLDTWCHNQPRTLNIVGCDTPITSVWASGGAGDDWLQLGVPPSAPMFDLPARLDGGEGNDFLEAGAARDLLIGGAGDDILSDFPGEDVDDAGAGNDAIYPGDGSDSIDGGPGIDGVYYTFWNHGFDMTTARVVDKVTRVVDTLRGIENLTGSTAPDRITGDDGANQLAGLGADDTITGGGGQDRIDGGVGNDTVQARDGEVDFIDCGPGTDEATVDTIDTASGCETVHASDELEPGADRDHDGYPRRLDCDDTRATVHPGAVDVPGNAIDEDCVGGPQPYLTLDSSVGFTAYFRRSSTRFAELFVRHARAGSVVRVRCRGRGCPFRVRTRAVTRDAARLDISGRLRAACLRPGSQLVVEITKPRTIGVLTRITVRAGRTPLRRELCLRPGSSRPRRCVS